MAKCEAATLKFSAPGIITICKVIIVRYNAILYQKEYAHISFHLSNYV